MEDSYQRVIDYLRISVTDRCNLRCVYCMPEEGVVSVPHAQILSYDEIIHLCRVFASLGVKKIKLTGGEPLVRKHLHTLVSGIKKVEGIEEVTLTTNGILLEEQAEALVKAGIGAVNISLDTLDAKRYFSITRGGDVEAVLSGMKKMLSYPEIPVKINCVLNDISNHEILEIANLAKEYPVHVRFIELMPIGMGKSLAQGHVGDYDQENRIRNLLKEYFGEMKVYDKILGNGPSQYYEVDGFKGKIGFISAMSHKFCDKCNRVRVTAEGYLKTCLQYEIGEDLFRLLREGGSDEEIAERIQKAIYSKPKAHEFLEQNLDEEEHKSMSQIGG